MNWVAVEFVGTQPTIIRGATGMRYTFVPNMRAQIDGRDLDMMVKTGLVRQLERG